MAKISKCVWIGTSGWSYKEWAKAFYPKDCRDELSFYVTQFPTVEINATFYRLPTLPMVRNWKKKAPKHFIFAVKGSRFLTHIKRLTDVGLGLRRYFSRIKPLAERTGPVLWQLPPTMPKDLPRLENFLSRLPAQYRHAVEFRHPSWMDEETFTLLREHRSSLVWISSLRMPMYCLATTDFVYIRFHGLAGGASHDYTRPELEPWAVEIIKAAQQKKKVFAYFNNDLTARAIDNARALREMAGEYAVN